MPTKKVPVQKPKLIGLLQKRNSVLKKREKKKNLDNEVVEESILEEPLEETIDEAMVERQRLQARKDWLAQQRRKYPVAPDGQIPNSIIRKQLISVKVKVEKIEEEKENLWKLVPNIKLSPRGDNKSTAEESHSDVEGSLPPLVALGPAGQNFGRQHPGLNRKQSVQQLKVFSDELQQQSQTAKKITNLNGDVVNDVETQMRTENLETPCLIDADGRMITSSTDPLHHTHLKKMHLTNSEANENELEKSQDANGGQLTPHRNTHKTKLHHNSFEKSIDSELSHNDNRAITGTDTADYPEVIGNDDSASKLDNNEEDTTKATTDNDASRLDNTEKDRLKATMDKESSSLNNTENNTLHSDRDKSALNTGSRNDEGLSCESAAEPSASADGKGFGVLVDGFRVEALAAVDANSKTRHGKKKYRERVTEDGDAVYEGFVDDDEDEDDEADEDEEDDYDDCDDTTKKLSDKSLGNLDFDDANEVDENDERNDVRYSEFASVEINKKFVAKNDFEELLATAIASDKERTKTVLENMEDNLPNDPHFFATNGVRSIQRLRSINTESPLPTNPFRIGSPLTGYKSADPFSRRHHARATNGPWSSRPFSGNKNFGRGEEDGTDWKERDVGRAEKERGGVETAGVARKLVLRWDDTESLPTTRLIKRLELTSNNDNDDDNANNDKNDDNSNNDDDEGTAVNHHSRFPDDEENDDDDENDDGCGKEQDADDDDEDERLESKTTSTISHGSGHRNKSFHCEYTRLVQRHLHHHISVSKYLKSKEVMEQMCDLRQPIRSRPFPIIS